MVLPVFVVTGFLDAGKTTFLNQLLNRDDWQEVRILLVQFETGEEAFRSQHGNCHTLTFPKKALEQHAEDIVASLHDFLQAHDDLEEMWVEWNGVVPLAQLQTLLLHPLLKQRCKIRRVLHIADATRIDSLLGRTGSALPEQIANSDFLLLRTPPKPLPADSYRPLLRTLRELNPGVPVYRLKDIKLYGELYRQLFKKHTRAVALFALLVLVFVVLHLFAGPFLELFGVPVNTLTNVFLGIILQAVPFLLIGVLLSSAIQVFVPQRLVTQRFPKSIGLGMLAAILAGFCLPVCDCASIPVFRSLVKKGVPLPVAITFMTATPVINPVVMLSTYYAFSGNLQMVAGRVCLGIVCSVLIGLVFALRPPRRPVLSGGTLDRLLCGCGCYEDMESATTFPGKLGLLLRHAQAEFFSVGQYLVLGTFVASVFQVLGTGAFSAAQSGAGLAVSLCIMMVMAFVLSLCSSSDAIVARSFASQFPLGAIMGFLVFGPMMDLKNILMLSSGFSKRFILNLLVTAFLVCFAVIFLLTGLGGM